MSYGSYMGGSASDEKDLRCPHCDAPIKPGKPKKCWLCLEKLSVLEGQPRRFEKGGLASRQRGAASNQRSAMVILGVVAILLGIGLAFAAPGALVFYLIAAAPFVVYAVVSGSRKQAMGTPAGAPARIEGILGWIGAVIVVGVTSFVAFVAAFIAVCTAGP